MTKLRRLKVRLVCLIYVHGFVVAGKTGRVMSNRQRYFTVDEALAQLLQEEDEDFNGGRSKESLDDNGTARGSTLSSAVRSGISGEHSSD